MVTLLMVVAFIFSVSANELSDAQRQQDQSNQQQSNAQSKLKNLTTSEQQMEKQIEQLSQDISAAEADL